MFTSSSTGAAVYVFSHDHCPPHVHARHRGDGWIARVKFSYVGSGIELMSVAPLKAAPQRRTVNCLLADTETELPACRRSWWTTTQTTCLINQWAVSPNQDRIELASRPTAGARQISEARYDPDYERLRLTFRDGTIAEESTQP